MCAKMLSVRFLGDGVKSVAGFAAFHLALSGIFRIIN